MAKKRSIIGIVTESAIGDFNKTIRLGDTLFVNNSQITNIQRTVGGLADVTSLGPAAMGPNCPSIIVSVTITDDEGVIVEHHAIPERYVVDTIFVEASNNKDKESEVEMSKEG